MAGDLGSGRWAANPASSLRRNFFALESLAQAGIAFRDGAAENADTGRLAVRLEARAAATGWLGHYHRGQV